MDRHRPAPPGNGRGRAVVHQTTSGGPTNRDEKYNRGIVRNSSSDHKRLVIQRLRTGLLAPFQCAVCGVIAFDPVARNGKHEHICAECDRGADAIERSQS